MIQADLIEVDAVVLAAMPAEMAPFEDRADFLGRASTLGKVALRLAAFCRRDPSGAASRLSRSSSKRRWSCRSTSSDV